MMCGERRKDKGRKKKNFGKTHDSYPYPILSCERKIII
jgi:hypothetical protein